MHNVPPRSAHDPMIIGDPRLLESEEIEGFDRDRGGDPQFEISLKASTQHDPAREVKSCMPRRPPFLRCAAEIAYDAIGKEVDFAMDVGNWLAELGLGQYADAFAINHVDVDVLVSLSDADLRELGVASLGHRKRILAAIAKRQDEGRAATTDQTSMGPASERRVVTVLFADISGFTSLSQSIDPEEVRECVQRFTSLVDGIVVGYGGTVDKHIGDAVMALFGAPRAHEDDAIRAVRAALDIHEALRHLTGLPQPLIAHIGIASGEVVAGMMTRVEARDYTVLGDAVNLAARLVDAAGPAQTLLSDPVYMALRGYGQCEAMGARTFKGIDSPIKVWRLTGFAVEPVAGARTPFVGRQAELEQFRSVLGSCLSRGEGQIIHVRGEAGIGKTRLVESMRGIAEENGFECHRALVLDFGAGKGRDPVRSLVQSLTGLSPAASPDERRHAAGRLLEREVIPADKLVFLQDLMDLPPSGEQRALYDAMDNATRNRGRREAAAAIVAHATRERPLLLIVEDLHWAEPSVLAHLAAIVTAAASSQALLVTTSRIEGDPVDAAWRARCSRVPVFTLDLGPLRREDALRLAGNYVDTTQKLALACIDRAAGNPLFLEQLVRNAEEGHDGRVPASVQSLVLARMDRLPERDRRAFQAASVIGQRFGLDLLRHLAGDPTFSCDVLRAGGLVLPEGDDFLFAHALIRDSAYASLLKAQRRNLHVRAADWFSEQDPTLYAQHLDRAEDARTAAAYLRAALAQRAAYHSDSSLALAERGLEVARGEADRYALLCLVGELKRDLSDIAGSAETFRQAILCAPDEGSLCQAQLGLAEALRVNEGLAEALAILDEAQTIAERGQMIPELARLHHLRGNIYFPMGEIAGCRREHEEGLGYARRTGSLEAEARALGGLADAAYAEGRMRSAFEYFSRCVAISREHGFGRIEVANRPMVGFSRLYLNEAREAVGDGDAAIRAASKVGQPRAELLGQTMGMFATFELGDDAAVQIYLDRARQLAIQLGARRFEAQCIEFEGRILLEKGSRENATRLLRESLDLCREFGPQFCGPKVASALALAMDDPRETRKYLAEGEAMLAKGAVGHNHLWFYRDAIEAMLDGGDRDGVLHYVAALEAYTRNEPLAWATLFIRRAKALVTPIEKTSAPALRLELKSLVSELDEVGLKKFAAPLDELWSRIA